MEGVGPVHQGVEVEDIQVSNNGRLSKVISMFNITHDHACSRFRKIVVRKKNKHTKPVLVIDLSSLFFVFFFTLYCRHTKY